METKDLTISEVCGELSIHSNTARRLIRLGVLPGYRAGLRSFRVTREALDEFKARGGARSKGRPRKK